MRLDATSAGAAIRRRRQGVSHLAGGKRPLRQFREYRPALYQRAAGGVALPAANGAALLACRSFLAAGLFAALSDRQFRQEEPARGHCARARDLHAGRYKDHASPAERPALCRMAAHDLFVAERAREQHHGRGLAGPVEARSRCRWARRAGRVRAEQLARPHRRRRGKRVGQPDPGRDGDQSELRAGVAELHVRDAEARRPADGLHSLHDRLARQCADLCGDRRHDAFRLLPAG